MMLSVKRILLLLIRFMKRLRSYGLFKTISYEFSEFRFDYVRNIHTRKINFMHELDLSSDSLCYAATTEKCFKSIIQKIEDKFFNLNFVDFGCGKGKVMILARENGFSGDIAGVELSEELCFLAEKNIQSCNISADVFNIDAASYKVKEKDSIFSLQLVGPTASEPAHEYPVCPDTSVQPSL